MDYQDMFFTSVFVILSAVIQLGGMYYNIVSASTTQKKISEQKSDWRI